MVTAKEQVIWWQIYPLGFLGAPIRPQASVSAGQTQPSTTHGPSPDRRGLDGLIDWLDYMLDMGANGLLLGPIFVSQTHGYDTLDYFHIDPRLGGDQAFDRLAQACRSKGIRLMLDGVFNHVGYGNPLFQQALQADQQEEDPLFCVERQEDGQLTYPVFEGHGDLPELNHGSQRTVELVVKVMEYWLARGADAWRLDAAYAVPTEFWAQVLSRVRRDYPQAWFLGEVIHGDYPSIIQESGMDSLTQYELWKAIWSSLESGNFYELDWSLQRHNRFLDSFLPQTFMGNHDVSRIASRLGVHKTALAATTLLTVGGIPSIYYGDERAWEGIKEDRLGGDDAIRPAYPVSPQDLGPQGADIFELIRSLIAIRRQHPWMTSARSRSLHLDNRSYSYELVGGKGQQLRVELNLDPSPHATVSSQGILLLSI
ncbi:alpha-amylase [Bifidobacterium aemilianum]|uniref:Alpha-amylase n=1 Tax=Bifidobacterium aemilianum TaxID=2493120 RepID=A0A366K8U9_9BIFI|nr:alpha-amylase family protein [Bifidobacterium aemilianum]RBP98089.1 alpha-amylase [Bifidobacterium aemilianum]